MPKKPIRRKVEDALRRREAGEEVYFKSHESVGVSRCEVPPTYGSLQKLFHSHLRKKAAWIDYLMGKFGFVPIGPTEKQVRSRKGIKDKHFVGTRHDRALSQLVFFEQRLYGCKRARDLVSFVDSIAEKVAETEKEFQREFYRRTSELRKLETEKRGPVFEPSVLRRRVKVREIALKQAQEPDFRRYNHEEIAEESGIDIKTFGGDTRRKALKSVERDLRWLKELEEIPPSRIAAKRLRVIPDISHKEVQRNKGLAFKILSETVVWREFSREERKELNLVALEGLRQALERYDSKRINPYTGKPYAFSSFAYSTIKGTILNHINIVLRKPEKIRTVSMDKPVSATDERTRHERIGVPGTQLRYAEYLEALGTLMRLNREGKLYARDIVVFVLAEQYGFSQSAIARSGYFSLSRERVRQILGDVEKVLKKNR